MSDPHWSGNHKDPYYTSIPVQTVVDWKSQGKGDEMGQGYDVARQLPDGRWKVECFSPDPEVRWSRAIAAFEKACLRMIEFQSAGMDPHCPYTEIFIAEND